MRPWQSVTLEFAINQPTGPGSLDGDGGITITVVRCHGTAGPVFVGLFKHAVPRKRPIVGAMLPYQDAWTLRVSNGFRKGFLLAAGFSSNLPMKAYFLPTSATVWVASAAISYRILNGSASESICLTLRPPRIFDPPILIALPLLLAPC